MDLTRNLSDGCRSRWLNCCDQARDRATRVSHMPGEAAVAAVDVKGTLLGTMQVSPDQRPQSGLRRAGRRMTALPLAEQGERHATSKRSEPSVVR